MNGQKARMIRKNIPHPGRGRDLYPIAKLNGGLVADASRQIYQKAKKLWSRTHRQPTREESQDIYAKIKNSKSRQWIQNTRNTGINVRARS